jgi:hypothetical protein
MIFAASTEEALPLGRGTHVKIYPIIILLFKEISLDSGPGPAY